MKGEISVRVGSGTVRKSLKLELVSHPTHWDEVDREEYPLGVYFGYKDEQPAHTTQSGFSEVRFGICLPKNQNGVIFSKRLSGCAIKLGHLKILEIEWLRVIK